jgi:transposase
MLTDLILDMDLKEYYADSNGVTVENPKFLRIGEKVIKRSVRRVSRKERKVTKDGSFSFGKK